MGTKQLKLDPSIYDSLQKEKVSVGDVIYIEASSGAVKRVGRSDAYATEFDLEAEEYVPLPKGDVHKKKEVVQDVTLHDLEAAWRDQQGRQPLHRPRRCRAGPWRAVCGRGAHARYRVLHLPQPRPRIHACPDRRLRDQPWCLHREVSPFLLLVR